LSSRSPTRAVATAGSDQLEGCHSNVAERHHGSAGCSCNSCTRCCGRSAFERLTRRSGNFDWQFLSRDRPRHVVRAAAHLPGVHPVPGLARRSTKPEPTRHSDNGGGRDSDDCRGTGRYALEAVLGEAGFSLPARPYTDVIPSSTAEPHSLEAIIRSRRMPTGRSAVVPGPAGPRLART
jgi:hypothetical protein